MSNVISDLTDDDIRTSWADASPAAGTDEDATDADEDATDADEDATDQDADGTDA